MPYFAALDHTFASHGLAVDYIGNDGGGNVLHGLVEGQFDICLTTVLHVLKTRTAEGALPVRFVYVTSRRSHMAAYVPVVDGRPAVDAGDAWESLSPCTYVGSKDSPDACEPRPGYKRYAREMTCEYQALRRRLGLAATDRVVDVPFDDVVPSLLAGVGSVTVDWLDEYPKLRARARAVNQDLLVLPFMDAPGAEVYSLGFAVRSSFLMTSPQVVRRFVAALRDAMQETRRWPRRALPAVFAREPQVDLAHAVEAWRLVDRAIFADGEPGAADVAGWDRTVAHFHAAHGTDVPSVDQIWAEPEAYDSPSPPPTPHLSVVRSHPR